MNDKPVLIPISQIDPNPYQPREAMDQDAIAKLAADIKRDGLMQIPSARRVNGHFQLAFGHRRLEAFKLNGESQMPLIIRDLTDLQMFERGVSENLQREDLNRIEEARAMQRYMDDFGKTSAEAAEFFGVSPEQVRATVRLLELNPAAQEKLINGEISVTTARTLLSMQKVAPQDVVAAAVDRIVKGEDRWGHKETPDEVIEEIMDEMVDGLKPLWHSHRAGKPRGGDGDAWLLDMKNFPVRFLPVLTPVDLALGLGIQEDEEILQEIDAAFASFEAEEWDLIHESLKGRLDGRPELLAKIDHLVKPPACTACPFYSVVQGTHYCGMTTCFDRKTRAWQYEKLRAASKDLKIEVYNKDVDGEFRVLEDSYSDNGKKHMDLFKKRSPDLRLALAVDIDRKRPQSGYQGVPSGSVVMLVGKSLKSLLETGQKERAEKRSKDQLRERLQSMKTVKRELMDWEVAGHVKALFDQLNMDALKSLWEAPRYGGGWEIGRQSLPEGIRQPGSDESAAVKEDFMRQMLAVNMVRKIGGYWQKPVAEYASHLQETVRAWGVKLPKSVLKLAAQMDAEIAAVTEE